MCEKLISNINLNTVKCRSRVTEKVNVDEMWKRKVKFEKERSSAVLAVVRV